MRLNMGVTVTPGSNDAYEDIVDISRYIPGNHMYLDLFLSADLRGVMDGLKKAVETGERESVISASGKLLAAHRYFEDVTRVHAYINRTLAQMIWQDNTVKDMDGRFAGLAVLDEGMEKDPAYWLYLEEGKGTVQSLLKLQEDLRLMVPVVFDDSGPLSKYPGQIRNGLYGLVCAAPSLRPELRLVPGKIILPSPLSMGVLRAAVDFDESLQAAVFSAVRDISNGSGEIPGRLQAVLDGIVDAGDTESSTEYDTPYLEDVLCLEVSLMSSSGTRLKRCLSCGRYFPVTDGNDSYCSIPGPDGSSCLIKAREKQLRNTVSSIYTQAYRTHYARVKAGKETKCFLGKWRAAAKDLRSDVFAGKLTAEEYKWQITHETEKGADED